MASPSIASYFNVRKRPATDDILNARNKVSRLDGTTTDSIGRAQSLVERAILAKNKLVDADTFGTKTKLIESVAPVQGAREKRTVRRGTKRTASSTQSSVGANVAATSTAPANKETLKQPKIVKFTLGGSLSPRKKATSSPAKAAFQSIQRNATPTKQPKIVDNDTDAGSSGKSSSDAIKASISGKNVTNAKKELTFDEIKEKIGRSSRLDDLKAILNRRQQLEERYQACINKRLAKQKANNSPAKLDGISLKAFETIELEVLSRLVIWLLIIYTDHFIMFCIFFCKLNLKR